MRSVELFAGGGGLAIGLEQAGFEPAVIIENNKYACKTLRKNYLGNSAVLDSGDIREFDYKNIGENIRLVSGGPPCQPFSMGGKHRAYEDKRDLFPEAVRAIRELRPDAFIFENVKGLLRKSFSTYFEYVLLQLQYPLLVGDNCNSWLEHLAQLEQHHTSKPTSDLSYKVCFRLLNAANFGVPQKRERVFIVGFRSDLDVNWSFPSASHSEEALLWDQWVTKNYWQKHEIAMPAIDNEQQLKMSKLKERYGFFEPVNEPWQTVRDAIRGLPFPTKQGSPDFLNHELKLGARSYPGHTGSHIDQPAKTLKAGGHGVPGGENMIRHEDGSVRYFTVRESARLQTFPDSYDFEGAWGEAMRQLGNAVPVQLAQTIGMSVGAALNKVRDQRTTR